MKAQGFEAFPFTLFKEDPDSITVQSWLQNPRDPSTDQENEHYCLPDRRIPIDWSYGKLYEPLGIALLELMERDLGGHADYHAPMPFKWIIANEGGRTNYIFSGQSWTNSGRSGDTPLIGISIQMANFQNLGFQVFNRELKAPLRTARPFRWDRIDDSGFERLLLGLYSELDDFDNVQWLQKTNAPDGGRDLSAIRLSTGERVLIQAKHQKSSLRPTDINEAVLKAETWHPPFAEVIMVTTGTFTKDAIVWAENHNDKSVARPKVRLESGGQLEVKISKLPHLVSHLGLR